MDLVWGVYGIQTPEREYRFCPTRRWRFDYAFVDRKIGIEIEGGVWTGGRHTRGSGFLGDMEKYNEAGKMGWRVFRFTPQELKNGKAQTFMKKVLLTL